MNAGIFFDQRMAWLCLIAIVLIVILSVVVRARRVRARHRRLAMWNNLHERGKLFASQLKRLRASQAHGARSDSLMTETDETASAGKAWFFLPGLITRSNSKVEAALHRFQQMAHERMQRFHKVHP